MINLVLVAGGVDDLITRNVIALWLPAALMLAGGLGARRAGVAGIAGAAVLCGSGIVAAVGVATERTLQRPDWRAVARVLGTGRAVGGERAILVQHYRDLLPLSLYVPGTALHAPRRCDGARARRGLDQRSPGCALLVGSGVQPVAVAAAEHLPDRRLHELWRRSANQFTIVRLVADKPVTLTRADVAAVLTTTTLRRDELILQR